MKSITCIAVLFVAVSLLLCGCGSSDGEGFAIYRPAGDILSSELPDLSDIDLEESPLVLEDEVVSYSADTHEMLLTQEAYDRIREIDPRSGSNAFIVCVDEQPVYSGSFTWMWSSTIEFGASIMQPLSEESRVLRIEYHSAPPGQDVIEDLRSDPRIIEALECAGKLE